MIAGGAGEEAAAGRVRAPMMPWVVCLFFAWGLALAIENLGADTPRGSALLCLAIVGGAAVPVLTGYAADRAGLPLSLLVPAACYLGIAGYGLLARQ